MIDIFSIPLIGSVIGGIIGNRSGDRWCELIRQIEDKFRREEPVYHHVHRAVRVPSSSQPAMMSRRANRFRSPTRFTVSCRSWYGQYRHRAGTMGSNAAFALKATAPIHKNLLAGPLGANSFLT